MAFRIESTGTGLTVRIDEVAGRESRVLEKIRDCRKTAWACPSGECMRIATMEESSGDGYVVLELTPRSDQPLSASGIEQCLRYMLHEVVTQPRKA